MVLTAVPYHSSHPFHTTVGMYQPCSNATINSGCNHSHVVESWKCTWNGQEQIPDTITSARKFNAPKVLHLQHPHQKCSFWVQIYEWGCMGLRMCNDIPLVCQEMEYEWQAMHNWIFFWKIFCLCTNLICRWFLCTDCFYAKSGKRMNKLHV